MNREFRFYPDIAVIAILDRVTMQALITVSSTPPKGVLSGGPELRAGSIANAIEKVAHGI